MADLSRSAGEPIAQREAHERPELAHRVLVGELLAELAIEILGRGRRRLADDGEAVLHHQDADREPVEWSGGVWALRVIEECPLDAGKAGAPHCFAGDHLEAAADRRFDIGKRDSRCLRDGRGLAIGGLQAAHVEAWPAPAAVPGAGCSVTGGFAGLACVAAASAVSIALSFTMLCSSAVTRVASAPSAAAVCCA